MEIPVNISVNNKMILGILNVPDHQRKTPIVVIMSYGFNGDRVEQHRMSVTLGRLFAQKGINVYRFDFRNQGISEGDFDDFLFSERQRDINEIVDYIQACFRPSKIKIYIIGFSTGCKSAIDVLYTNESVNGVILWNPILQELSKDRGNDAGDSRRLYKHPITGKPYKRFYSLRLNLKLLYELQNDSSMSRLKSTQKNVLCVLSRGDETIKPFCIELDSIKEKNNIHVEYIDTKDHLFGKTDVVQMVLTTTLEWILAQ